MAAPHFRAGVVVVVRHPDRRQLLAFERIDVPGAWQLPQGGMESGEEPVEAAWRELHEETHLGDADVVLAGEHPEWLAYEWPAGLRADRTNGVRSKPGRLGQVQRWFLFDATHADIEPHPDGREFGAWQWCTPEWLLGHVAAFRRTGYERALTAFFPEIDLVGRRVDPGRDD